MAQAIVTVGYVRYVLEPKVAMLLAEALTEALVYESVYVPTDKREPGDTSGYTYHAWKRLSPSPVTVEFIDDDLLRIAKLAGEPHK